MDVLGRESMLVGSGFVVGWGRVCEGRGRRAVTGGGVALGKEAW